MEKVIKEKKKRQRQELNYIRALAIIGIVGIHVISSLCDSAELNSGNYIMVTLLESIFRMCLPAFFILSGALLIPSQITNIKDFYKKRITKIIPDFLFAALLFTILHNINSSPFEIVKIYVLGLINVDIFTTFWFVYVILALYLITPFISKMVHSLNNREKMYMIIIILMSFLVQTFCFNVKSTSYIIDNLMFTSNPGFFLLGGLIADLNIKKTKQREWMLMISMIISVAAIIIIRLGSGYISKNIYSNSIFMAIMAIDFFLIFSLDCFSVSSCISKWRILSRLLDGISSLSYLIYLFHPILLSVSLKLTARVKMPLLVGILCNLIITVIL